jgi:leader peptidase (prepilin peptidase) / N-methyltransferase
MQLWLVRAPSLLRNLRYGENSPAFAGLFCVILSRMEILIASALFLLGAIIASFMGVVAERLYTGQSIVVGRSRCDACGKPLSASALIPLVSYIASGGRSRCCGVRLSYRAPMAEILLGLLFAASYFTFGLVPVLPFFLVSLSLLLGLVLYDLAHQILPPPLMVSFIAAAALTGFLRASSWATFSSSLAAALLIGGSLALVHVLSRGRAMGFADAPLAFGLALLVGPPAFSGFVFSFWVGAVVGIILLLERPSGSRMGVEVPFAPFLAAGFLLAHFTQWNPFAIIAVLLLSK